MSRPTTAGHARYAAPVATTRIPDYEGGSLPNVVAELEERLTSRRVAPPLHPDLAALIPVADTYVVVLFDGLGDAQLDHPAATSLNAARVAAIDAPFPTTTTVSMATVATAALGPQGGQEFCRGCSKVLPTRL